MKGNLTAGEQSSSFRQKWWFWPAVFVGLIIVLASAAFAVQVFQYRQQLAQGEVPQEFADRVSSLPNVASPAAQVNKSVVTSDDPFLGPAEAKVVIVGFEDFQCPFCLEAFPIIREVMTKYQDRVKFIFRDFPIIDIHLEAAQAALAAECAHEQGKFWEYHDKLFLNQADLSDQALRRYAAATGLGINQFNDCLRKGKYQSEVQDDFDAGVASGVRGTPTWFINGRMLSGVIPLDIWEQIIEAELSLIE